MDDTDDNAKQVQIRILRSMSPAKRLALATGWSNALRDLIRADLKSRFQGATEPELKRRFADRWLGADLATKVYGPFPTEWTRP